jgi:hypothetical protein
MKADAEKLISTYIRYREHVAALKAEVAEKIKPFEDAMRTIENAAAVLAKETGQIALKSESGTAFPVTQNRVRVDNRAAFHEFVFANNADYMLTAHVSKEAVLEWQKNHEGKLPPGIIKDTSIEWQFRRA